MFYLFSNWNHHLSTTGQVWAYSRMTIGKPIRRRADWDTDVEFPLLLTWYNRLRSHHFQMRVEDARRHLDIMEVDGVSIKLGHSWVLVICLEYWFQIWVSSCCYFIQLSLLWSFSFLFCNTVMYSMMNLFSCSSTGFHMQIMKTSKTTSTMRMNLSSDPTRHWFAFGLWSDTIRRESWINLVQSKLCHPVSKGHFRGMKWSQ